MNLHGIFPAKRREQIMQTKENNEKTGWDHEFPKGTIKYRMTNDFMFKKVFQQNSRALKGLLCALLDMKMEEIETVKVLNPIREGDVIDDKSVVLDLRIILNNNRIIDIEMQVEDEGNWEERSLTYLSREFDQLQGGESYKSIKQTIHIGILDFTPKGFPEQLYMDYYFYHYNTGHKYSDKMSIRVLQLNQLGKREDEDKMPELYHWAQLFKAASWEEMRMLAEENEGIKECVVTLKELSADERARMQYEARVDYQRRLKDAELYGIEQGIEKGIEKNLVYTIDNAMHNLNLSLEQACMALGVTLEAYKTAKEKHEILA